MKTKKIAIGGQLSHCENVITLGIKRNLYEYNKSDLELIYNADKIYFPSFFLYEPINTIGKKTFPNPNYYRFFNNKIKQKLLFDFFGILQPKTRIYSGQEEKRKILKEWSFPFIAKIPKRISMGLGVFLIKNKDDLDAYNSKTEIAYIQEYLKINRDLRVVLINKRVMLSYWKIIPEGEYRSNVSRGGLISFENIPQKALNFAKKVVELCDLDNVGLDICEYRGEYYVFEANMGYGIKGFVQAGIDFKEMLRNMVENDEI